MIDAGVFGKYTLMHDPEASSDCLYPKKITHELASSKAPTLNDGVKLTVKPLDLSKLMRMCKDLS